MAKRSLQLPLTRGLWTKRAANEVPEGALTYARDCVYKAGASGLRKRGVHLDLDSSALSATGHGITQYQNVSGTINKIVVHAGANIYQADTSTSPTLASASTAMTDAGPTTFLHYDDQLYVSNGAAPVRVTTNGTSFVAAGIPNDKGASIVVGTVGTTNWTIANGVHVTYRYWDSVNDVYSDVATDLDGNIAYGSVAAGTYDGITVDGLPTVPPGDSGADSVVVLMTQDETNPTVFYPVRVVSLTDNSASAAYTFTDTLVLQPTTQTTTSGYTRDFTNEARAYDDSFTSAATGSDASSKVTTDQTVGTTWSGFPSQSASTSWYVQVKWSISGTQVSESADNDYGADGTYQMDIDYSTNAGGAWTNLKTNTGVTISTTDNDVPLTTTRSDEIVASIDPDQIHVRATIDTEASAITKPGSPTFNIHDIRVLKFTTTSHQLIIGASGTDNPLPLGSESPSVNAANVGQYQPPPVRIFPNTFEGHALGKSTTNGLFLAYSITDAPRAWSTNPQLSAFPYLVPFKDKEADDLVGADKVANQLIVFATDSVWRINHLPVLSDPSGSLAELFAEARNTVKRRVTDTVGCVGVRAYTRMQLSSDEDFVFFWSRLGPMMTDGFRVWRVADHVDWSWLNDDQSKCVVTNFTSEQRIEVELRSTSATVNDVGYIFHYDPENLLREANGIRLKVLGPHPRGLADTAEVKYIDGTKGLVAVASAASDGSTHRLYAASTGTDVVGAADFNWATGRIQSKGAEARFDKLIFNVDEDGSRGRAIGDSTVTLATPLDKDPMNIDQSGQSLEVEWDDDVVTFRVVDEDEQEIDANQANESVSFTTSSRVINSATLIYDDGEEIKD